MSGAASNWSLKEEIRGHWSARAATFDACFGHRNPAGPEAEAWRAAVRAALGPEPLDVLELASGTGEVTGVLLGLGHRVTGLDFSEAMIERARAKHRDEPRARFRLADAENTREADAAYDAILCRHLVWTLTDPAAALADWHRVLRPGGRLVVFDGDFVTLPPRGRLARRALALLERILGPDAPPDPELAAQHARILRALPFATGLTFARLRALAEAAGFEAVTFADPRPIQRAQRRAASPRDWLRTWLYDRFILTARKPAA